MRRNYQDPAYEEFRKAVRKRDQYRCRMPGCKCKKRLQVHHIRRWAISRILRYEISNGITLCYACHKSIKNQEHLYEAMFTEIVNGRP